MNFYAHRDDDGQTQRLKKHLVAVARFSRRQFKDTPAANMAALAGLLHDLGKYSTEYQRYLMESRVDSDGEEAVAGKGPDHSSAGAQFLRDLLRQKSERTKDSEMMLLADLLARMVGHCIVGHHSGLLDGHRVEVGASLDRRLTKALAEYNAHVDRVVLGAADKLADNLLSEVGLDAVCQWITKEGVVSGREAFALQFFIRQLFSAVVDGDRLDAEKVSVPDAARTRQKARKDEYELLLRRLETHLAAFPREGEINGLRREISTQCAEAARLQPGFFSLTVPTGGGKTLASLRFALHHVRNYAANKSRIIYVMPYTTIIEQNAEVFRRILDPDGRSTNVLEHHASLVEERETQESRLLAENWDAPIVVTTSVQFFEALYSNRPGKCRRLHSVAGSVIILDEAQIVPLRYLKAVTWSLEELVKNWGCTVVFCTATQPVLDTSKLDERSEADLRVGLVGIQPIIGDTQPLFRDMKRVDVKRLAAGSVLSAAQVSQQVGEVASKGRSVLAVVNTKKNARDVHESLANDTKLAGRLFHLSTAMCPQHRLETIVVIRSLLGRSKSGEKVAPVVVSTQLIEAGVDLDFDVVFRAMAGIDSIAQAAGRCNREGRIHKPRRGEVFVYEADEKLGSLRDIIEAKRHGLATLAVLQSSTSLTEDEKDPIGVRAVEEYFERLCWSRRQETDTKRIVDRLIAARRVEQAADIPFASVAADFSWIEQETIPVVVPYALEGRALLARLKNMQYGPALGDVRMAQRFSVQLWKDAIPEYRGWITELACGIRILESNKHYHPDLGLLGPDALTTEDYIV